MPINVVISHDSRKGFLLPGPAARVTWMDMARQGRQGGCLDVAMDLPLSWPADPEFFM